MPDIGDQSVSDEACRGLRWVFDRSPIKHDNKHNSNDIFVNSLITYLKFVYN